MPNQHPPLPRLVALIALFLGACSEEPHSSDERVDIATEDDDFTGSSFVEDSSGLLGGLCRFTCRRDLLACGCLGDFRAGCYDSSKTYCIDQRVSRCSAVENPSSQGPRCCPVGSIPAPAHDECRRHDDLSPNITTNGTYLANRDLGNFVRVAPGVLEIVAVRVHDNAEGDGGLHGPHGNLYVDFFDCNEPLDRVPDGAERRRLGRPIELRGPHNTHGSTDEWLDDEAMFYRGAGILEWGARSCTTLRVWESDSSEDGSWGRRNDVICMERVRRSSTEDGVHLVRCVKYTNDHPRRRQPSVPAMFLWVRTP